MTHPQAATADSAHPFDQLTPHAILAALEDVGLFCDGRLFQLNSFENRVFQAYLEGGDAIVVKFYRPGRWTDAQIEEEHAFALELAAAEVPVVAPLPLRHGTTLAHTQVGGQPFRLAVYPRMSGAAPDLERPDTLAWLGRFIGRLHAVGARKPFIHRTQLTPATFGRRAVQKILSIEALPLDMVESWRTSVHHALDAVEAAFDGVGPRAQRLHGDCHLGNILWRDAGPHIVDLDDACTGPAIQDLWMFLSGDPDAVAEQIRVLLEGYRCFATFDPRELALIEPLRTLRMIHHSAWLAERWSDPAFPIAFPWFGTAAYWTEQVTILKEQLPAMASAAHRATLSSA